MIDSQRVELDAILHSSAARPRPALKYDRMSAEEFVIVWTYQRCVTIFSVLAVVAGVCRTRGVEIPDKEITAIMNIAEPTLAQPGIIRLAEKYYEPGICWVLAECMDEQPHVIEELENRMRGRRIGKYLAVAPSILGKGIDVTPLRNFLCQHPRIKRLLQPFDVWAPIREPEGWSDSLPKFRENEHELGDLQSRSLTKACELVRAASVAPAEEWLALPPYPLQLRSDVQNLWDTTIAEVYRSYIENNAPIIAAGLSIDDAAVVEKVKADLRNFWQTDKRRQHALSREAANFHDHEDSFRVDWAEIISVPPTPESRIEAYQDQREILESTKRAYRIAMKRSGPKGRNFLDGLKTGLTVTEAASAARINTRTGNRILEKIRKNHSL